MSSILRKQKALIPSSSSLIVTGLAILMTAVGVMANPSFASAQQQQGQSTLSGIITSTQLNDKGVPQWLSAGSWTLVSDKPIFGGSNETKPTVKSFDAVIDMVSITNGTMFHTHHISNFKQSEILYMGNNNTAINGTMTVTTEHGPTENVPGFIQLQNNMMSVWISPGKIGSHFGPTPINGMILSPEKLQEIRSLESPQLQQQTGQQQQQQGNSTMPER